MADIPLSPRRLAYLAGVRRQKRRIRIWQIALLVGLFGFWELSCRTGLSDGFLVSCPSRMAATFWSLCRSGQLWRHIGVSCLETVAGFTVGTLLGTAVAVLMWWSDTTARILDPYLVVLNALPKTALGPIFIVWMGAGTGAIVTMTLAISLIVTILNMYTGFRATDPEKVRLMRTLGATRRQILWMLVFPANCPTLFSTLKVNVGLSWVGVIMGEFLVSRAGLGYLIVYGSQVFNMDLVMTSVLILAAAAVVTPAAFRKLRREIRCFTGKRPPLFLAFDGAGSPLPLTGSSITQNRAKSKTKHVVLFNFLSHISRFSCIAHHCRTKKRTPLQLSQHTGAFPSV